MINQTAMLLTRSLRPRSAFVGAGLGYPRRFLTTVESPLHEFFVVIFNKRNAKESDLAPAPQTIKFKEQDVILTFAGDMMASAAPATDSAPERTLGACFRVPGTQRAESVAGDSRPREHRQGAVGY
ncbi:predicted protein [Aspergillus nidulans FGSC A4]|uniref:Aspercryptin biosynthesis cluster protein K n=1 Tax=Emericella nidulans (strain FGSC A4 / ATCC 38163 / CBS 112.46 / NRRL 194 / M139) TaxID=227321 RepID=ATNK_EMENI|nr:protein atnK [Aspergillus nidulans FGSC A4]Q5AV05.1 RecName: Full=Aspercryptin biosynthesis cluster protein K [Aspergillus nidulans FGSC A4]EAA59529.1 predicted protein [Aspergillus nidulans FGSC A4]CBF73435.1 TPA: conserved hypothetical protein [Aspergillus nidulans FGSC A4]|eukprot:XP_681144.1 predicted protein [Aspergillus nidulans FGSC A4]